MEKDAKDTDNKAETKAKMKEDAKANKGETKNKTGKAKEDEDAKAIDDEGETKAKVEEDAKAANGKVEDKTKTKIKTIGTNDHKKKAKANTGVKRQRRGRRKGDLPQIGKI